MIVAINYANEKYRKQQRLNSKTARWFGKVDKVYSFSPEDIDSDFREANGNILSHPRGNGLWLWKPYFINKVMRELNDGDVICYADSGIAYLRNVCEYVERLQESRQDIMLFEIPLIECQWTRKSVFQAMDADTDTIRFSNQVMGTIIIIIISKYSRNFIQKWLELCQNADLIFPKEKDAAEDNLYFAHREDQSILSVLAKKEGIVPFSDPTDFGKFPYQYLSANRLFRINKREKPYQLEHIYMLLPRKANPYIYFIKICLKMVLKKLNLIIRK